MYEDTDLPEFNVGNTQPVTEAPALSSYQSFVDRSNQDSSMQLGTINDTPVETPEQSASQFSEDDEKVSPDIISYLTPEIIKLPPEEAFSKLTDIYKNTNWTDKEIAAQKFSEVSELLNKQSLKDPEITLNTDAVYISHKILDQTLSEDDKLNAVETWREDAKRKLYNSDDVEQLKTGVETEKLIDAYADHFRRSIIGKPRSAVVDAMAGGAESALAPLVGTADLVLGTESKESVSRFLQGYQDPSRDDSWTRTAGNIVGGVAGFAAASVNPVTAFGYLGATIVSQGKDVYDTALKETGSEDAARRALLESQPGILLGAFADKIVGGSLGKLLQGKKGYAGAMTAALAGGLGGGAQIAFTGEALKDVTGKKEFGPTPEKVAKEALIFGAVGGVIGGVGDYKKYVEKTKAELKLDNTRAQLHETLSGTKTPDVTFNEPTFSSKFVDTGEEFSSTQDGPSPEPPPQGKEDLSFKRQESFEKDQITPEEYDSKVLSRSADEVTPQVVLPIAEGFTPSAFLSEVVKRLDGKMGVEDLPAGLFGFYDPLNHLIKLNKAAFKDPEGAHATMAHEIGHMLDAWMTYAEKLEEIHGPRNPDGSLDRKAARALSRQMHSDDLLDKLVPIRHYITELTNGRADVNKQAYEFSLSWRPPYTKQQAKSAYRKSSVEVQADVFSALFSDPARLQAEAPLVWDAFNQGLDVKPEMKQIWTEVTELIQDPVKLLDYTQKRLEEGRIKEAQIVRRSAEETIDKNKKSFGKSVAKGYRYLKTGFLNRFNPAKEVVDKSSPEARAQAFKLYEELYAPLVSKEQLQVHIDIPFNKLVDHYLSLGMPSTEKDPLSLLKTYTRANRILSESSRTIENIRNNPERYAEAGKLIEETFLTKRGLTRDRTAFKNFKYDGTVDELEASLAKLHSASFDESYRNWTINNLPSDSPYLNEAVELLSGTPFNVRRYLANPDMSFMDAKRLMANMRQQLGAEKFKQLEDSSKSFHKIIADQLFTSLQRSGIYSQETMDKLKINKDNYITFNILKYFEQDPNFTAKMHQQFGTLEQSGDELASTISKSKAIYNFSEYQIAQNAAVELAKKGGYSVVKLEPEPSFKRGADGKTVAVFENVFEKKAKLSKENPEKSYLIQSRNGQYNLYEIDSPKWAEMFAPSKLKNAPIVGSALEAIDIYNNLFKERELKTVWSLPFYLRQKFIDRANERIVARSFAPSVLPFHLPFSELSNILAEAGAHARKFMKEEFTPVTERMIKGGALPFHYNGEYGTFHDLTSETRIRNEMGISIPKLEEATVPYRITKKVAEAMDKTFFGKGIKVALKPVKAVGKKIQKAAEFDEARTKIAGYLISKKINGLSDAEAVAVAREYFGTPDTFGGGTESTQYNKLFLFGRAHVNGLRAVANQLKDDPKGYGTQFFYHKFMPKILTSSAIMAPLITAMFGEEEGKVYKSFLDKIGSYDKASKYLIPLGFTDEQGNFRGFNVRSDEITPEWKAKVLRIPTNRELYTIDSLISPFFNEIEDYLDTGKISAKHFLNNTMQSFGAAFVGNVAPAIQGAFRTGQLVGGYNPYDFYRKRGILTKDVQEAGSFLQRTYDYLAWSVYNTAPGIFSNSLKQSSTESLDPFDYIAQIPLAGPSLQAFVGDTNYGDYELGVKSEQAKAELDADVRLNMGDDTKATYNEYTKYNSLTRRLGKDWERQVGSALASKIRNYMWWHTKVYVPSFNELRNSFEKGDDEQTSKISRSLEDVSSSFLKKQKEP